MGIVRTDGRKLVDTEEIKYLPRNGWGGEDWHSGITNDQAETF